MKGMMLKDFYLLKELRKMVILFAAISVMMTIGGGNEAFVMGYFNVLMLSVAMNSTSYDDYNNGYSFLFTLPVTRKEFVCEKYIFGFLVSFSGWLYTVILTATSLAVRGSLVIEEWVLIWLAFLGMSVLGLAVSLPAAIKYGSDKGRIMMIVFMAAVFVVVIFGGKLAKGMNIDLNYWLYRLLEGRLLPILFAAALALALLISYNSSVRIMEKKEF